MSTFEADLIQSMTEALAMSQGAPIGRVTHHPSPREVRAKAGLTQEQMAPLMGLSLSGYRKIEQGQRGLQGSAAALLLVLDREPEAVKRALDLTTG